ncbi:MULTISPECIES: hypothetical protein [unclassified Microbacterium]|uniref:hypothetical protein n=1 Tax=unclassified Microbacterium TaxID=2609290 RepID=UPI000EAA1C5C|nr:MULTISPECIES: hypothetical protein [unclassified Microbacterium]MBT2484794.1 hypothetical protein [Microbacterium sp. ISL-108]RKN67669.1 hypothetical protein D7252_08780 [Microbacterium sp. CGR2]
MSAALRAAWLADMARLVPQIEPHLFVIDGQPYIGDTCPPHLAELHTKLASIGYANGFYETESAA